MNITWSRLSDGERSRTLQRLATPLAIASMPVRRRFLEQIKKVSISFHNKLLDAVKRTKQALINGPSCTCNKKLLARFDLNYMRKK